MIMPEAREANGPKVLIDVDTTNVDQAWVIFEDCGKEGRANVPQVHGDFFGNASGANTMVLIHIRIPEGSVPVHGNSGFTGLIRHPRAVEPDTQVSGKCRPGTRDSGMP